MQITNHTDLLNHLATTFNLQYYLEIGVRKPELNFDKIKLPNSTVKFGIDPAINETHSLFKQTSDEFFANIEAWEGYFDLIFIDGLHHADQVKRDFENSLKCLTDNGFIVIHDTLPTKEKYTHVPRDSKIWFGDVYKFACSLWRYSGVHYFTLDVDCGCTIAYKEQPYEVLSKSNLVPTDYSDVDNWEDFKKYKHKNLNTVSMKRFKQSEKFNPHDALHSHTI